MRALLIILLAGLTFSLAAQNPEEEAIKTTLNRLFTAMQNGDTLNARSCFDASARLQTIRLNPQTKKPALATEKVDDFIKSIAAIKTKRLHIEERIINLEIRIDGALATVWAPYEFYIDTKFSHKGTNAIQLFNSPDGWKIVQICDTRNR